MSKLVIGNQYGRILDAGFWETSWKEERRSANFDFLVLNAMLLGSERKKDNGARSTG